MAENGATDHSQVFSSRAEMLNQGVKGLFLANGGAAIAILAFLGQIVEKDRPLAIQILEHIDLFAYGVACASLIHFVRFFRAFFTKSTRTETGPDFYTFVWAGLAGASLILFVLGIVRIGSAGIAALQPTP